MVLLWEEQVRIARLHRVLENSKKSSLGIVGMECVKGLYARLFSAGSQRVRRIVQGIAERNRKWFVGIKFAKKARRSIACLVQLMLSAVLAGQVLVLKIVQIEPVGMGYVKKEKQVTALHVQNPTHHAWPPVMSGRVQGIAKQKFVQ